MPFLTQLSTFLALADLLPVNLKYSCKEGKQECILPA